MRTRRQMRLSGACIAVVLLCSCLQMSNATRALKQGRHSPAALPHCLSSVSRHSLVLHSSPQSPHQARQPSQEALPPLAQVSGGQQLLWQKLVHAAFTPGPAAVLV